VYECMIRCQNNASIFNFSIIFSRGKVNLVSALGAQNLKFPVVSSVGYVPINILHLNVYKLLGEILYTYI